MRVLAALLALLVCVHANAAPECAAPIASARLAGQGGYTWFGLSIYEAQLWVGKDGYRSDGPYALELRYARSLNGRKIAQASVEQMEHTAAGTPAQRAAWLRTMAALFPDVHEGSRICGLALATGDTRFYLDDKVLGEVADPAFTRAFFGIWFSPASSARRLREQLLANAAPR